MRILLSVLFTLICLPLSSQVTNNGATIVVEQGGALSVEGSAGIVNNTGTITNNGEVRVAGDLTNTGTLTLNGASATLTFMGDQDAVLTPGNNTSLTALRIEKEDADLILAGPLSISGVVDFIGADNGRILLGDADMTLGREAAIDGATPANYIVTNGSGFLVREVMTLNTAAFPIGSLDGYSPLTSDYTGTAGFNAAIKVKVTPVAAADLPAEAGDFLERHWEVVASDITTYENEVSATYLPDDVQGDEALIEGASFADGVWSTENAGRNVNMVTGIITGPDAIFTGYNSSALPVELLGFEVTKATEKTAHLSWSTASEINTSHFDLERSTDGFTWLPIGTVAAAGESSAILNYQFLDNTVSEALQAGGVVYYRIDMVDVDGSKTYSPVRSLVFDVSVTGITVFPNPTVDQVMVSANEPVNSLTLRNNLGKLLITTNMANLSLADYPAGVYYLSISAGGQVKTVKVVRVH